MLKDKDKKNCFGYAYFRLGLSDRDEYLFPDNSEEIWENFDSATSLEEADAIAVTRNDGTPAFDFVHLATIDPEDKDYIIHRPYTGTDVIRQPLTNIYQEYGKHFGYKIIFLKLRTK